MTTEELNDQEKLAKRAKTTRLVSFQMSLDDYETLKREAEQVHLPINTFALHCVRRTLGLPSVFELEAR